MKFVLIFFALFVAASADIWKNCGSASDHMQIINVVITPNPPVKGQTLTVALNATLDEIVQAGTISIDLKLGLITIVKIDLPLCSIIEPYEPCPVKPGPINLSVSVDLPSQIPSGHYTGNVKAVDQNNEQLACIQLDLRL